MQPYHGISASDGIAIGPAFVWRKSARRVDGRKRRRGSAREELAQLESAIESTGRELGALREQLLQKLGPDQASILDAQLLILEDEDFLTEVRAGIDAEGLSAAASFARAMAEALIPLNLSGDGLFQERMSDFRDLEQRVLRALAGEPDPTPELDEPHVLIASQLTPSETAGLDISKVLGFCLEEGGTTSHVAIMARSLGVPAVVGLRGATRNIPSGTSCAVDGTLGVVHVDPTLETLHRFEARIRRRRKVEEQLLNLKDYPAETPDGRKIVLSVNVDLPFEIDLALESGARGIGLLRTEYFYFQSTNIPGEDEQVAAYTRVIERARGESVIFRALDVGGDKLISSMGGYREYNPFLGLRGTRFLLSNPELLRTQLRALYRSSSAGPMKIMFPMITGVEELRALNVHGREVREELTKEGHTFDAELEVGIMIETPSAVALAPELAADCDFFSIGTNDLTQYVLAVDRGNPKVAHLYRSQHPAVLRAIRDTVKAAHDNDIWVGLCGEMGSNPIFAVLLVGLGIDELSTHAAAVPAIKKVIRTIPYDQARAWADEALSLSTSDEVDAFLKARAHERLRDFLDMD